MKTLFKRLSRLEQRMVPVIDHESFRLANLILDRRRRRLEASGEPFEHLQFLSPTPGPYLSYSDSLRFALQQRRSRTSPPRASQ